MLFIPQEQVKKTLKRLRKEGKERRRIESEKRKAAYLKAKEEGKLDEYYAEIERKWNELHPPKKEFRKTISNIGDGNMKIIEDYAKRKVDKSKEPIVTNLRKEGFKIADIARIADVSNDFVKKTLSK